jgi:hypothetical protein
VGRSTAARAGAREASCAHFELRVGARFRHYLATSPAFSVIRISTMRRSVVFRHCCHICRHSPVRAAWAQEAAGDAPPTGDHSSRQGQPDTRWVRPFDRTRPRSTTLAHEHLRPFVDPDGALPRARAGPKLPKVSARASAVVWSGAIGTPSHPRGHRLTARGRVRPWLQKAATIAPTHCPLICSLRPRGPPAPRRASTRSKREPAANQDQRGR